MAWLWKGEWTRMAAVGRRVIVAKDYQTVNNEVITLETPFYSILLEDEDEYSNMRALRLKWQN